MEIWKAWGQSHLKRKKIVKARARKQNQTNHQDLAGMKYNSINKSQLAFALFFKANKEFKTFFGDAFYWDSKTGEHTSVWMTMLHLLQHYRCLHQSPYPFFTETGSGCDTLGTKIIYAGNRDELHVNEQVKRFDIFSLTRKKLC